MSTTNVSVSGPIVQILTGEILDENVDFVTFKYKKPRSSKYIEEVIATKDIIATYGEAGEGEGCQLVRKTTGVVYEATGKVEQLDDGSIRVTPEDDSPTTFYPAEGFSVTATREVAAEKKEDATGAVPPAPPAIGSV